MDFALSFDLGSHLGCAQWERTFAGWRLLRCDTYKCCSTVPGVRWQMLMRAVGGLFEAGRVDTVAFERVDRHQGTRAAQVYGGMEAFITYLGAECGAKVVPMPVSTWKKLCGVGPGDRSTGKDAAKHAYIARLNELASKDWRLGEADAVAAVGVGLAALNHGRWVC